MHYFISTYEIVHFALDICLANENCKTRNAKRNMKPPRLPATLLPRFPAPPTSAIIFYTFNELYEFHYVNYKF